MLAGRRWLTHWALNEKPQCQSIGKGAVRFLIVVAKEAATVGGLALGFLGTLIDGLGEEAVNLLFEKHRLNRIA